MGCSDLCKIQSTEVVWHDGQQEPIKMYNMEIDPAQSMFMIQLPEGAQVKHSDTTGETSTYKAGHEHVCLISAGMVRHLVFVFHALHRMQLLQRCLCTSLLRA